MEEKCTGHVKCCLNDPANWPLVMEAILVLVNRMFCLVFIIGFVIDVLLSSDIHYGVRKGTKNLC